MLDRESEAFRWLKKGAPERNCKYLTILSHSSVSLHYLTWWCASTPERRQQTWQQISIIHPFMYWPNMSLPFSGSYMYSNVPEMEKKKPEAILNGPLTIIHWWLITLMLKSLCRRLKLMRGGRVSLFMILITCIWWSVAVYIQLFEQFTNCMQILIADIQLTYVIVKTWSLF